MNPLPTHYCQTWQHLPDYGAYHATLIADPALPGKWQPGEDVVCILVFKGDLTEDSTSEDKARNLLTLRLSETLPIPILDNWFEVLWEAGIRNELINGLTTAGDCLSGFSVHISETSWANNLIWLLKDRIDFT